MGKKKKFERALELAIAINNFPDSNLKRQAIEEYVDIWLSLDQKEHMELSKYLQNKLKNKPKPLTIEDLTKTTLFDIFKI